MTTSDIAVTTIAALTIIGALTWVIGKAKGPAKPKLGTIVSVHKGFIMENDDGSHTVVRK